MNIAVQKIVENRDVDVRGNVDPLVLNLAHLAQYTCGDGALEQELLGLFKDHAVLQFENVETAVCKDDWVMAVHTLKGSARSIGATQVADLSADLEHLGYDGETGANHGVVSNLKHAVAVCIVTIETLV